MQTMTFFTSPQFLWSSVGLTFILVVVAVLVRGAAGGSKEVANRQGRMWSDIFLKSLVVRWMIAAAIAGIFIGASGILSHLSGVSAALSPSRVFPNGAVQSDSHGGMPPANDISTWWKINLPPEQSKSGGKSKKIPIPPHMRPLVDIQDARVHCVYGNGKEIAFGVGEAPCPVGNMPFFYVSNSRKTEENVASYTFVPIK